MYWHRDLSGKRERELCISTLEKEKKPVFHDVFAVINIKEQCLFCSFFPFLIQHGQDLFVSHDIRCNKMIFGGILTSPELFNE